MKDIANIAYLKSDLFGAIASGLCLAHCLATPLLFVAQSCTASCCADAASPGWWSGIDYLFLLISIVAIFNSAKATSLSWVPLAMFVCWILLSGVILNEQVHLLEMPHEVIYLPALALVGLHLYNRKYCHCLDEACCVVE